MFALSLQLHSWLDAVSRRRRLPCQNHLFLTQSRSGSFRMRAQRQSSPLDDRVMAHSGNGAQFHCEVRLTGETLRPFKSLERGVDSVKWRERDLLFVLSGRYDVR